MILLYSEAFIGPEKVDVYNYSGGRLLHPREKNSPNDPNPHQNMCFLRFQKEEKHPTYNNYSLSLPLFSYLSLSFIANNEILI